MDKQDMMKIVAGVKRRNGKTKWLPLGLVFRNKDGKSWSVKLETIPRDPDASIQLFPFDETSDDDTPE